MNHESLRILSARRAYVFQRDHIRLTMLSLPEVIDRVKQRFGFQIAEIAMPTELFGPVSLTMPPGVVFQVGAMRDESIPVTPIHRVHIEPTRIVIDVSGPSEHIDPIFDTLCGDLADVRAGDGTPVLGTPEAVLNYSEIAGELPFAPDELLSPGFRQLVQSHTQVTKTVMPEKIVPSVQLRQMSQDAEFRGSAAIDHETQVLELRAGITYDKLTYFSAAPLDTSAHLEFLAALRDLPPADLNGSD